MRDKAGPLDRILSEFDWTLACLWELKHRESWHDILTCASFRVEPYMARTPLVRTLHDKASPSWTVNEM